MRRSVWLAGTAVALVLALLLLARRRGGGGETIDGVEPDPPPPDSLIERQAVAVGQPSSPIMVWSEIHRGTEPSTIPIQSGIGRQEIRSPWPSRALVVFCCFGAAAALLLTLDLLIALATGERSPLVGSGWAQWALWVAIGGTITFGLFAVSLGSWDRKRTRREAR